MILDPRLKSLATFVSKDIARPVLQNVYVDKKEMIATDNHVLAIAPLNEGLLDDEFPKGPALETSFDNILISKDQIESAFKLAPKRPVLPCLKNVQVGTINEGKGVGINVGMPVTQVTALAPDVGPYPDVHAVIPTYENPHTFCLDGKMLKQVCDLAIKHGNLVNKIEFKVNHKGVDKDAVLWSIENEGDTVLHGLIMPLRPDNK